MEKERGKKKRRRKKGEEGTVSRGTRSSDILFFNEPGNPIISEGRGNERGGKKKQRGRGTKEEKVLVIYAQTLLTISCSSMRVGLSQRQSQKKKGERRKRKKGGERKKRKEEKKGRSRALLFFVGQGLWLTFPYRNPSCLKGGKKGQRKREKEEKGEKKGEEAPRSGSNVH